MNKTKMINDKQIDLIKTVGTIKGMMFAWVCLLIIIITDYLANADIIPSHPVDNKIAAVIFILMFMINLVLYLFLNNDMNKRLKIKNKKED